jgi:ribonucleotide reductase beta subunit family protein with ferritin-like domain
MTSSAPAAEPLLAENPNRFSIFPVEHRDMWDMYKKQMAVVWIPEEVDLTKDIKDWDEKLNDNERYFVKHVLAFFANSDGIVMENLMKNFSNEVEIPEARFFYAAQNMIESVHAESYALMIDTYIRDKDEKLKLLRAIHNVPCVEKKAAWAMKWMDPVKRSFAHRVLAFSVVEGVHFSASFCAIFWLKKRGLMPGLCQANLLISRDEGLHTDFACLLYSKIVNKLPVEEVHAIIKEAVEIEVEFITESIPCNLIGMNSELMIEYIKYVADRHCVQLGYPKIYNAKCEFEFMELISLGNKGNHFEVRITEYSKSGTLGKQEDRRFATDVDF